MPQGKKTILANFNPEKLYEEMQDALDDSEAARLDIVIAAIPCQPFSQCGKGEGFDDEKNGRVFFTVLKFINEKLPKSFILGNVVGMKYHDHGKTFRLIMDMLRESKKYNLHEKS